MSSEEMSEDFGEVLNPQVEGAGGKRKAQGPVAGTSRDRKSFDFFAELKSRKKPRLGFDTKIADIKHGWCPDGIMKFRVSWSSGYLPPKTGTNYYLNMLVEDGTRKITCTAFGEVAEQLSKIVEPGKAYQMIGIEAEVESEKYNISGNALKLTIRDSRSLKEISGNEIPPIEFHFKTFSQLRDCRSGEIADFLGIMVRDWGTKNQKGAIIRDITFTDANKDSGTLSFFGDLSSAFVFNEFQPAAIAHVTVKDFRGGKSFNVYGFPLIENPSSLELAISLKREFDEAVDAASLMEVDD